MSLTFTQAQTVAVGDKITSKQYRCLARAFNTRLLSGIGDSAWRVAMWWFNAFRQFRLPNADGSDYPAQGEAIEQYQDWQDADWPVTSAGDPQGANLANVINQFVYSEPDNVSNVPLQINGVTPSTPDGYWELAKAQRGAIDPNTNLQNWPAGLAAQAFLNVTTPMNSPHGKSYGGYFPSPVQLLANCGTTAANGLGISSFEIKFTKLSDSSEVTYIGSCPLGTEYTAAGHVVGIARLPFAFYVAVNDGAGGYSVDEYDRSEWIEGPYEGIGRLAFDEANHADHGLFWFASEFRGTASQRAEPYRVKNVAFDFQKFSTAQYALAPSIGESSVDNITAAYPLATYTTGQDELHFAGAPSHKCHSDFVIAAAHVKSTGLVGSATVDIMNGTTWLGSVTVDEATPVKTFWFSAPTTPEELKVNVRTLPTCETLSVEFAELLEYKPQFWDAYLILRLAASTGATVDGQGIDITTAKTIGDNYFQRGCITNENGRSEVASSVEAVTINPIYQAMRRASKAVRFVNRKQFISYAVTGNKTVLRFRRWNNYSVKADAFAGIAPDWQQQTSDNIIEGETYIVRSDGGTGGIQYDGQLYTSGQTFAASTERKFSAVGDGQLYKYDGLMRTARKQNITNAWCAFLQSSVYHPATSSQWTPQSFSDWLSFQNRCLFYPYNGGTESFRAHVNWTQTPSSAYVNTNGEFAEAPTGYTYGNTANNQYGDANFYTSCQIYQPPYELESVTVESPGENEIVVITFTSRFITEATAPATVDANPGTWSATEISNLRAEAYRTDDNLLREYALMNYSGQNCTLKTGDTGTASSVSGLADNPFGSCFPHFFFVRQIPEPFEDDNESQTFIDTRCEAAQLQVMEVYLRAMCEGFVDGVTTEALLCDTGLGSIYDYRFTNLCFDAFQGNWIGAFSLDTRSDNPAGHGPLPNTIMQAEVFNRIAASVNLLTRARVMLPFTIDCQLATVNDSRFVTPDWWNSAGMNECGAHQIKAIAFSRTPNPGAYDGTAFSALADCTTSFGVQTSAILEYVCGGDGGTQFKFNTTREYKNFQVKLSNNWELAIPESWRDDVAIIGGFLLYKNRTDLYRRARKVATGSGADCGAYVSWFDDGIDGYVFDDDQTIHTQECLLKGGGRVDSGTLQAADFPLGRNPASAICTIGSSIITTYTLANTTEWFVQIPTAECS